MSGGEIFLHLCFLLIRCISFLKSQVYLSLTKFLEKKTLHLQYQRGIIRFIMKYFHFLFSISDVDSFLIVYTWHLWVIPLKLWWQIGKMELCFYLDCFAYQMAHVRTLEGRRLIDQRHQHIIIGVKILLTLKNLNHY
jgi:hypothetical protein